MDTLDLNLMSELQKDGRQSFMALARKLLVAEGTVRRRVKRLLDAKLTRIVAIPNVGELGYKSTVVMALQVSVADVRTVADALIKKQNVCYLALVTGRYDLIAIVVTQTNRELSVFLEKEIWPIPNILRIETFVTMDILKGSEATLDVTGLTNV